MIKTIEDGWDCVPELKEAVEIFIETIQDVTLLEKIERQNPSCQ